MVRPEIFFFSNPVSILGKEEPLIVKLPVAFELSILSILKVKLKESGFNSESEKPFSADKIWVNIFSFNSVFKTKTLTVDSAVAVRSFVSSPTSRLKSILPFLVWIASLMALLVVLNSSFIFSSAAACSFLVNSASALTLSCWLTAFISSLVPPVKSVLF